MVDIKETTILSTTFSEKIDTLPEAIDNNFIDDEMDNLEYSDSESASIAMPEDEFSDALDHFDENQTSKQNGKCADYNFIFICFVFSNIFNDKT